MRAKVSAITQEIPLGTSRYPFYPMLWLGMEEAGLQFFTEHRHGWTGDRNAVFTIERRADDSGTVLVHLRERLEPGEEFRFEVGLLASPVKPLPELHPLFNLGDEFAVRPGRLPVNAFFNCAAWGHETEDFFADLRARPTVRVQSAVLRRVRRGALPEGPTYRVTRSTCSTGT